MPVGNRVFLKRELPDKELVKAFSELPAANVADAMGRLCALHSDIKLMSSPTKKMCGVALTVKARPGDNLALHKALNISEEGDVIVVSNEGDRSQSIMGEIMYKYLSDFKKIEGIVIDGPIRDIDTISQYTMPIYATGTTPGGPYKEGPGEVNVPIACGRIAVNPGDIILGDADGVIVIPKNDAAQILEKAKSIAATDAAKVQASASGTVNRQWVDDLLDKKGFEVIDDVYRP
ncbi:RraA family protein [Clostridium beijerinckii]|uniref:RraA family protein n=1 Tax=Clostridium beijerinckii TaxID=1520 RepID=UPI00149439D4|nr:RraA family protein [Clostridium beijerinckii]NOW08028.1 regulator of RNase E activity RraA [Clostridium beijerinckii]NRT74475.1 regulator of RNase E activity RraA [Clostridium beijerinckii]NYC05696.1 regulator of RNase E activity RraA [Clostridium beijerinckii]